ncbi:MAG: MFS transporter [Deltaproteobacteria bacterium]|nr:MFS transporter [Deltaproteobacteria bacterium]
MWFATAAFSPSILVKFELTNTQFGILASSALWAAPILRPVAGFMADRLGAPKSFFIVLIITGTMSIVSSQVESYKWIFVTRAIVAMAGVAFVIGIQHVAQWFEEEEMGAAEGLYAGTGNAGAGAGMLLLPRLYGTDFSQAFLHLGIVAIIIAFWVIIRGVSAKSAEQAAMAKRTATLRDTAFVWTRYAAVALMLAYAMCFGLEISMNAWISGYYKMGFEDAIRALGFTSIEQVQIAAGTFGAVQSFNASLFRPFSGYVSDLFQRRNFMPFPIITKALPYSPRLHWLIFALLCVTTSMIGLTLAGLSGSVVLSVLVLALFGICVSFGTGATFAIVPLMFKERPGTATGFIGGISCLGGVLYPIIYGNASNIHMGYAYVAIAIFIPIMLFYIWAMHWDIAPENHGIGSKESWLGKDA